MRKLQFTSLLICLFFINSFAQDLVMVVRQSQEQGFTCIDENGTQLFQLPPGYEPTVRATKEPFKLSNFYFLDFSSGVVPVTDGNRYFLMNREGKEIKDMGNNINWISSLEEGYFRVYERFENRRNASIIVYHDIEGNPAFDGRKFWEASRFRDGRAVVQLDDGNGAWQLMDKSGQVILNLSDTIPGEIRRIAKFERGSWQLSVKKEENSYSFTKYYLRPDGALSNRESDLWKYERNGRPHYLKPGPELDKRITKRINAMQDWVFPPRVDYDTSAFIIMNDAPKNSLEAKWVLYNHNYEIIHLDTTKKVKSITPLDFRGKKLIALKITERNDSSFVFYSIPDFEAGHETPNLPYQAKVEDNLLIFYKKNSTFAVQASKIVNLDTGKTIYEPDASTMVFTSIREAMKYKESVTVLDIKNVSDTDLQELKSFPGLKVLKMEKSNVAAIPEGLFSTFSGLTALKIEDFPQIKKFPEDIRQLKQLRNLFISDCPNIPGIEPYISSWPALREIRSDFPMNKQKIETLMQKYPKLKIYPVLKAVSID